ncbi:MAG: diaminopimelate decarboxylase [Candidatus Lokiarchaeota archaeon]|nr:diaminopimelate decarboxylase [Candidatus Lokiarchaeota archaeon]MBD3338603.1 diaminopimelate decarboxylase [Candidatus Lokiarchaeota archaeon]
MQFEDWLKLKELEYKDGVLFIDGVSTIELAEKYGTPIYVINEQKIRRQYNRLKKMLDKEYEKNKVHFAVKSNSNLSVLRILNTEGASFDCSSTGEIFTCFKAGVTPDKIIYTGNMFTDEDFEFAVKNDVLVNLDSISQLKRLNKAYQKLNKEKGTISMRINPEFGAGHHVHTITAGKELKFGILDEQVIKAYSKAKDMGFKKFGIHQHIGSGIINALDFEKAAEKFLSIVKKLTTTLNINLEFIDFGGGLGIPYRPNEEPLDLGIYNKVVIHKFKETISKGNIGEPYLFIEPGRFISAESTILLSQINTIKNNGYKMFAGVNAGFNTLIRPTMYGSYHHILLTDKKGRNDEVKYDVTGPICESGDILGKGRTLPELKEGDYLAILDAGAYGYTMSSAYNSRPRPAEVLINEGKSYLVREAETFEDLIRKENIPEHLT